VQSRVIHAVPLGSRLTLRSDVLPKHVVQSRIDAGARPTTRLQPSTIAQRLSGLAQRISRPPVCKFFKKEKFRLWSRAF
jgi:hypothetical protein